MRAVIQRVSKASVTIGNDTISNIKNGMLIFLGIETKDGKEDSLWLAKKIVNLRIFADEQGKMNNSIIDIDGELIVVSQFTLHAKTKKGNRPSFIKSATAEQANSLYMQFKKDLSKFVSKDIFSGHFGTDMKVSLINDGPITIIIDTKNKE